MTYQINDEVIITVKPHRKVNCGAVGCKRVAGKIIGFVRSDIVVKTERGWTGTFPTDGKDFEIKAVEKCVGEGVG